jgi:hypothetical protein
MKNFLIGSLLVLGMQSAQADIRLPKAVLESIPGQTHEVMYWCRNTKVLDSTHSEDQISAYIIKTAGYTGLRVVIGRDVLSVGLSDLDFQVLVNKKAVLIDQRSGIKRKLPVLSPQTYGFHIGSITAKNTDMSLDFYRDQSLDGNYACDLRIPSLNINLGVEQMLAVRP